MGKITRNELSSGVKSELDKSGILTELITENKDNLVGAVNETKAQINNLDDEVIAHKADYATEETLGHIKLSDLGKNYEVTITDSSGTVLDTYTKTAKNLFFEVTSPQNINIKNLNGKAFVKTSLDLSELTDGQVSIDYDGVNQFIATGELKEYNKVASVGVDVNLSDKGFVLENASYDSVSFSVASESTTQNGITFNDDGTKLYMVSNGTDSIYQYSLSTPFDLDTISYDSVSFSVASEDGQPNSIIFNNNGNKLYMVGAVSDSIHQYSLSTPHDLTTITYDNVSFSVASEASQPTSIAFNSDGNKLFVLCQTTDSIYQYTLTTPFDLSTISYDNVNFSVASQDGNPRSITFNNNGSRLYMAGYGSNVIYQYSLTSAFDLSTISYDNVGFSVGAEESVITSLRFNNDGSKLYTAGQNSALIYQYSTFLLYNGTTYICVEY